jgi:hypothetical protein
LAGLVGLTALLSALTRVLRLLAGLRVRLAALLAGLLILPALVLLRVLLVLIWIRHVELTFWLSLKLSSRWLSQSRITTSFFTFLFGTFFLWNFMSARHPFGVRMHTETNTGLRKLSHGVASDHDLGCPRNGE